MNKTINELLKTDVHEEEFLLAFHAMLEKFATEYDDMANMKAIQQASELLKTFNE
jgi:hypothetical protein